MNDIPCIADIQPDEYLQSVKKAIHHRGTEYTEKNLLKLVCAKHKPKKFCVLCASVVKKVCSF